jgi:hypothetical protein
MDKELFEWVLSGLVVAFMGLVGWLNSRVSDMEEKQGEVATVLAEMKVKVNTMWEFQMRRAISEVSSSGMGTINSPITMKPEVIACFGHIRDQLVELNCDPNFQALGSVDQLLEIEQKFGGKIFEEICLPNRLSHGACLIAALMVAKQVDSLDIEV